VARAGVSSISPGSGRPDLDEGHRTLNTGMPPGVLLGRYGTDGTLDGSQYRLCSQGQDIDCAARADTT